jgi:hypothetical protein
VIFSKCLPRRSKIVFCGRKVWPLATFLRPLAIVEGQCCFVVVVVVVVDVVVDVDVVVVVVVVVVAVVVVEIYLKSFAAEQRWISSCWRPYEAACPLEARPL